MNVLQVLRLLDFDVDFPAYNLKFCRYNFVYIKILTIICIFLNRIDFPHCTGCAMDVIDGDIWRKFYNISPYNTKCVKVIKLLGQYLIFGQG